MATGERNFSTKGEKPQKNQIVPLPAGDWQAKIRADKAEIRRKPEPGKLPYVTFALEALDSATEGGKNKWVYHNLFLSMKPGKNGGVMYKREDQLLGLARAFGEEFEGTTVMVDGEGGEETEIINPKDVLKWLKNHDGDVVQMKTKVQAQKGWPDKAEVTMFVEAEPAAAQDEWDGVEEEAAEEVDEEVAAEVDEEGEAGEELEEDAEEAEEPIVKAASTATKKPLKTPAMVTKLSPTAKRPTAATAAPKRR